MLLTKMQVFSGTVTKQNKHVSHQRFYTLVGTLKLSQTSPDVPNSEGGAHKDLPNAHSQQQVTPRSVSSVCVFVFHLSPLALTFLLPNSETK